MRCSITVLTCLTLLTGAAMADDRVDRAKKKNTDMCITLSTAVRDSTMTVKQAAPYCACVSDTFWDSVPKSEQKAILENGASTEIRAGGHWQPRAEAAQATCKKKLGF
jgi:TRAP-type C4-dicarboxylate transport system substrate-binding protein